MNRRLFLSLSTAGIAALCTSPSLARNADAASALVRRVSDEMVALIRSPVDEAAKRAAFVQMMDRYADMRQIAGYALGRYMRAMPADMKDRYIAAFKRFVAATYVAQFSDYSGGTIDVGRAAPTQRGYTVETTVQTAGSAPFGVRWNITDRSGQPLVEDFVIEGISMAEAQRSEFGSLIDSYGGDLNRFVQYLESRG